MWKINFLRFPIKKHGGLFYNDGSKNKGFFIL